MPTYYRRMEIVERFTPFSGQEWLQQLFQSMIDVITPYVKGKIILDAGCGAGYASDIWIRNGAKKIDAYDISEESLGFARKHYRNRRIHFQRKDFNTATFKKNYYDICVSMEVLEHVRNYEFHLKQIYSSLKKGGYFFLTTPNATYSVGQNEYHVKEFNYKEAVVLLKKHGFTIVKTAGFNNSNTSAVAARVTPRQILPFIKALPFYPLLMKLFFKPSKKSAQEAETMLFVCKKH